MWGYTLILKVRKQNRGYTIWKKKKHIKAPSRKRGQTNKFGPEFGNRKKKQKGVFEGARKTPF